MDRRNPTLRAWKAWTLFLLALVAVGAPVWANAYVCPMDRAAKANALSTSLETVCCPKAQTLAPPAYGVVALEIPCDCAQVSWDVSAIDHPRTSNLGAHAEIPSRAFPVLEFTLRSSVERLRQVSAPPPASSAPALWVLNQSIRC